MSATCHVLLVPHHGSKTSSSAAFLDAVAPQVALVQAGCRNRFGHPAAPVVQRYTTQVWPWWIVPIAGMDLAILRTDAPQGQCQRDLERRYWHHQFHQA